MRSKVKEILKNFSTKDNDSEWSLSEYKPSETGKWTHCYHRYPAKFIPQLVEKLIDEYIPIRKKAHINDPFFGCGTTIVTAISRGFVASGTEINKIAYLITKVKSTPIEPVYLRKKIENFFYNLDLINTGQSTLFNKSNDIKPLIPHKHIERINYWFTEDNKIKIGKILRLIYLEEDDKIRDFLLVAFSHILKNCSLWLQSSTKPTRDLNKNSSNPIESIKRHLLKMQRGNEVFWHIIPAEVRENIENYLNIIVGDARKQPVKPETVDMIITSSPYVTSYEYADLHQLSTIWLDFANDLKEYKKKFIGSLTRKENQRKLKSVIAQDIVNKLKDKDKRLAKSVKSFFVDMQEVFEESYRILKHGGRACYVIGNTKLKGVEILNAEIFTESMSISGFKIDRIIKREVPLKILPQKRDERTGKFASNDNANTEAYPVEYIIIGLKR